MSDIFGKSNDLNDNTLTGLLDIYADNIYTNTETVNTELQVNRGDFQSLYVNGIQITQNGSGGSSTGVGYWGQFWSTQTQPPSATNTAQAMTVNNIDASSNGVSYSNSSRINILNNGVYNIQFSVQLVDTLGAGGDVYIWLKVNGVDVAASTGRVGVAKNGLLPSWNFIIPLKANDYFQFYWSTTDIHTEITYLTATTNPTKPTTASLVITVQQVVNQGTNGTNGTNGMAATIQAGSATSLTGGSTPTVTNIGNTTNAIFNFGIPSGINGINGTNGTNSQVSVIATNTLSSGSNATVVNSGTSNNVLLTFGIPRGKDGNVVNVGTTTTLNPDQPASVQNSGTTENIILDFYIPKGDQGDKGDKGNKGDTGESTLAAIAAATAAAASAATAGGFAAAASGSAGSAAASATAAELAAGSINTNLGGRVTILEAKTQYQTADSLTSDTNFGGQVLVQDLYGFSRILLNGRDVNGTTPDPFIIVQRGSTSGDQTFVKANEIVTPKLTTGLCYVNSIDTVDTAEIFNIGKFNGAGIKIGNPILNTTTTQIENVLRVSSMQPYLNTSNNITLTTIDIGTDALFGTIFLGGVAQGGTIVLNGAIQFAGGSLATNIRQWV